MSRLCIYCKHFNVEYEGDYSDVTPGAGFTMSCRDGKYSINNEDNVKSFRETLETGLKCDKYEKAED